MDIDWLIDGGGDDCDGGGDNGDDEGDGTNDGDAGGDDGGGHDNNGDDDVESQWILSSRLLALLTGQLPYTVLDKVTKKGPVHKCGQSSLSPDTQVHQSREATAHRPPSFGSLCLVL